MTESTDDFTWSAIEKDVTVTQVIIYEDGPQPRDATGRFRKRRVIQVQHHREPPHDA